MLQQTRQLYQPGQFLSPKRTLVSSAVSAAKRPVDRTAACWGAKAEALAAKVNKRALESFMVNGD